MDDQKKTVIYQGRPINVEDIPKQAQSLAERAGINGDVSQGQEAIKLMEFYKNLDK